MDSWIDKLAKWFFPDVPMRWAYVIVNDDVMHCLLTKRVPENRGYYITDEDLWYCDELRRCVGKNEKFFETQSEAIEVLIQQLESKINRAQQFILEKTDYVEFLKRRLKLAKANEALELLEKKTGEEVAERLGKYLILENAVKQLRLINSSQETHEEDSILEEMDILWNEMTEEERAKANR